MPDLLAEFLRRGLVDAATLESIRVRVHAGEPVDQVILDVEGVTEERLLPVLADWFALEQMDLGDMRPDPALLARLPARVLVKHQLFPLSEEEGRLKVATARPCHQAGLDELRLASGLDPQPVLASSEQIARALAEHMGVGAATVQSMVADAREVQVVHESRGEQVDLAEAAEDASIIRFVNQVLIEAIERRATDVHFEPFEGRLSIRYRIDGVLREANLPAEVRRFQAAIVSRLKILSHLDIAEKRLPQDGRIKLTISGRQVDVRVSVIPMLFGEAVVLRLLDRSSALAGLRQLGMDEQDLAGYSRVLNLPHGIVLVTGPTGSGKTTTLYASLAQINDVERKIITIEDPIEYHLEGVNQIQVDTKTGLTFAKGLRAILRHDPDVVLVGEIRDRETADIAVQASLTGHLVFSTLHTNDAPGSITRLIDMGIEPFLVASSLEMVVAQRLVRVICSGCRQPIPEEELALTRHEFDRHLPPVLHRGSGCSGCSGTGYRGRLGVFEIMPVSDQLRTGITDRLSARSLRQTAVLEGMKSLREDGWRLVREGRTTVEEVLRVTKDERMAAGAAEGEL